MIKPSKKMMALGGVGVISLAAFSALFTSIVGSGLGPPQELRYAMDLLDEGRWDLAGRIARDLESAGEVVPEEDSRWQYVTGVSKLQSVMEDLDTPRNRKVLLEATEHLKKGDELGFPLGYEGKGEFYLGFCLFNTYRWDDAIKKLEVVPMQWPPMRSEAFRMMVDAQLQKQPPDFAAAKAALAKWQSIPGKSQREFAGVQLAGARLAFATGNYDQCEEELMAINPELPEYFEAMLWRGRWRVEATDDKQTPPLKRESLSEEAADILRQVMVAAEPMDPEHREQTLRHLATMRRQATFVLGRNQRQQGKLKEALATFSGIRQRSPHSAEAISAGLEEAEILLEAKNLDGTVNTVHHILRNIEDINLYNSYWLPIDSLKSRLLDIGRNLRNQAEYDRVIELANYLGLAFPRADTLRLQAETYEQWGDDIASKPLAPKPDAKEERRKELNAKYHLAAETFEQLSLLEMRSSEYPQIVWQSADNYRKANELDRANLQLDEYLRHEERFKRAQGLVALGRNYVNAGEWKKALEPLERCLIEYATNPVGYDARLLAARAKMELGQLDEAIELLESNLGDFQLDPQSSIWQDSLFDLGQMIFDRGDELLLNANASGTSEQQRLYEEQLKNSHDKFMVAVHRLREAVSRYPDDERYYSTRYLLARSYRMAAKMPESISKSNANLIDSARRELLQQRRSLLEQALTEYRALYQDINERAEIKGSTEDLIALTRNCYFGEADALYDLGRWEDAIVAYRNVASRFLNQPEALEALVQLADCHRKLGREQEAKKTLAQAEQVLRRIPADQDSRFVAYTRASRPEWEQLLAWLRNWN